MSISSIDDLLMGGKTSEHPATPENQYQEVPAEIEEVDSEITNYEEESHPENDLTDQESENINRPILDEKNETDEYGNTKVPENEAIRERLKKQARKYEAEIESLRVQLSQQGASQQVQQAAKDFEYNPEDSGDWQQQLAGFVKQTVNSMTKEQNEAQARHAEHKIQAEFETKFRQGMNNFNDFVDVMSDLPFEISNPMTLATRAMSDPAAFLYAAAKRQPAELERISKLRDPYAQMTEMGKLEERMRRNKPTTKAPRPLGRTHEDTGIPETKKNKSDESIEALIAKSDAKKLSRVKSRRGGSR